LSESFNDDFAVDRLEGDLRNLIENALPRELEEIYGLGVKTRVIAVRDGSIIVFFGALLTAIGIFASYSDFFESIALVRKHCQMLAERLVRDRYSHDLQVSVRIEHPDPDGVIPLRRIRHFLGHEAEFFMGLPAWPSEAGTRLAPRRDAFFWFLAVVNLLLLAAVALLVWAAVRRTYFPG
jgi:hypothetical protein